MLGRFWKAHAGDPEIDGRSRATAEVGTRSRLIRLSRSNLARGSLSASARIDSTDSGAEKGMVSLFLMRPSFASSSPVSGGFFGVALILIANGVPGSAKPWPARSLPAALRERALARLRKLLIAVPAAAETDPQ